MRQAMYALAYLHTNNICHRDLKPENFLLLHKNDISVIKMIDFGLAQKLPSKESIMNMVTGSPYYVSPQVLKGQYTMKCDIWSMGVLMYLMLSGAYPFNGNTQNQLFASIKKGQFKTTAPVWKTYSKEALNLLHAML
jgi:calcium-dependent protein kinase